MLKSTLNFLLPIKASFYRCTELDEQDGLSVAFFLLVSPFCTPKRKIKTDKMLYRMASFGGASHVLVRPKRLSLYHRKIKFTLFIYIYG